MYDAQGFPIFIFISETWKACKGLCGCIVANGSFLIHKTAVVMGMNSCETKLLGWTREVILVSSPHIRFPADNLLQLGNSAICHNLAANSTLSGGNLLIKNNGS